MYEPREDSFLLQSVVKKYAKGKVLDMGTGSGIIADEVKKYTSDVLAVDIDEECVKKSKEKAVVSDLFSNIKEKFDVIFFNPPYLPSEIKYPDLDAGKNCEVVNKFLEDAKNHLNKNGKIIILVSSLTKVDLSDYKNKIIAKKKLPFEELFVFELSL
ncbi:MAG: HemK2/MTQ2 family protein methyltransferase [archaeon]